MMGVAPPRPFTVAIPDSKLAGIAAAVRAAQLPEPVGPDDWSTGMGLEWLAGLRDHWLDRYDWRAAEARINRHPQFLADIDGVTVHFYHVPGKGPSPKPVLIAHGWPYSLFSFAGVIDRLTNPARYGGDPADALTVVAPSLPGYGYSSLSAPPLGPLGTMRLFRRLMRDVLGHRRFGVQGGDIGSLVAIYMAHEFPGDLLGLHLNIAPDIGPPADGAPSPEEAAWRERGTAYLAAEFDYMRMQANKPMMIGTVLRANPMATAAWIAEKFWSWTDHDGDLDAVVTKDALLTEVMAYVATDTIASGFSMYRMIRDEIQFRFHPGTRIAVPTGVYLGPKEYAFANPGREVLDRGYDMRRVTRPARGGHLPFLENEEGFASDVASFFSGLA